MSSTEQASRIAIGSAQFGLNYGIANSSGKVDSKEVGAILHLAHCLSIQTIDTAIAYGDSEIVLGQFDLSGFGMISKLPALPENIENVFTWVNEQVQGSLTRLNIKKLDGVLLHRPEQLYGHQGKALTAALETLKEQGYVEKIGVSIYDPLELPQLMDVMNIEIVQAPFNIIDRRLITSGWLQKLSDMNIEIHTRSVFMQGLLLMNPINRPIKFAIWDDLWHRWEKWLLDSQQSAIEACLQFVLSQSSISRVIVGVDSSQQLLEVTRAAQTRQSFDSPAQISSTDTRLLNPSLWGNL